MRTSSTPTAAPEGVFGPAGCGGVVADPDARHRPEGVEEGDDGEPDQAGQVGGEPEQAAVVDQARDTDADGPYPPGRHRPGGGRRRLTASDEHRGGRRGAGLTGSVAHHAHRPVRAARPALGAADVAPTIGPAASAPPRPADGRGVIR